MNYRLEFAAFLQRVAAHAYGVIEWQKFIVCHYQDEQLEEIRRKLAKMTGGRAGGKEWSDSEFAALQQWSRELKCEPDASPSSHDSNPSPPPKDWRQTVGMFQGDPIMKEIIDEALKSRETERAAARRQP